MFNRGSDMRRTILLTLVVVLLFGLFPILLPRPDDAAAQSGLPWHDKSQPFGVVATLGNRVRAEDIDAAVGLMQEAGVQWQREEIFWDRVQQESGGPFTWTGDGSGLYDYDRAIGAQVAVGINILGLLDYNPAWFKGKNPHPDEWIEDWGHFVYAAVTRYGRDRDWVKYWELWNEPNLAGSGYESGLYEVADFVRILQVGRAAALAADPEAKIVMGGLASIWGVPPSPYNYDYFTYLEMVAELGGWQYVDVIAIHPYRPDPPEGELSGRAYERAAHVAMNFRSEMRFLDNLLLQHGAKPVWLTELGWSTSTIWPGVSEDTQAFFLVRNYILAITHPSIEKVFWYDLRNDTDPNAPYHQPVYHDQEKEFHYGLLRRSYPLDPDRADLRKPSFLAYRTMTQMLSHLWLNEIRAEGNEPAWPGVYWYSFAGTERRVDVLWKIGDAPVTVPVNCNCSQALVRNWNGEVTHLIQTTDGTVQLRLNNPGAPIYVEYDPPVRPGGDYFAATGHSLRGGFRDYWHANGGMERFGYPITEELVIPELGHGRPKVIQYFERARFEYASPVGGGGGQVRLTRLGDDLLRRQGINWQLLPRVTTAPDECDFFPKVGHSVCPPFHGVWEWYGGVDGLGYPITEGFDSVHPDTGQPYKVQYFERARLEYRPEHHGTPSAIEFGMLGREYLIHWGAMP